MRILLVEDHPDTRELLALLLGGHAVDAVGTVADAQAFPADAAESLAAGFAVHLAKPAGLDQILAAIAVAGGGR